MPYSKRLILCPALPALLLAVSGCKTVEQPTPIYPRYADLVVEQKPVPPPEIVTSEQAAALYDVEVEAWGERGWRTVARICRWAAGHGAAVECPPAPEAD